MFQCFSQFFYAKSPSMWTLHKGASSLNVLFLIFSDFKALAISFITVSFEKDQKDSIKLLCKKSNVYENGIRWKTTPLDIAYEIDHCPSFIGHESVQHLLQSVWTGAMPINVHWWQVLLMFFFPPYIWFVEFTKDTIKYKKSHDVDVMDFLDG